MSQEEWTAESVASMCRQRITLDPYELLRIGRLVIKAASFDERTIDVVQAVDGRYHARLVEEHAMASLFDSAHELPAVHAALAWIGNQGVDLKALAHTFADPALRAAFRRGLHLAATLMPYTGAEYGFSPPLVERAAADVCDALRMPRPCDLGNALGAPGRAWPRELCRAASHIHGQLLDRELEGWSVEDAEGVLAGGHQARAILDDMEARLGIDVSVMRAAIVSIPDEMGVEQVRELAQALDLVAEGVVDAGLNWYKVQVDDMHDVVFSSEREALVAGLEARYLSSWRQVQSEMDFADYLRSPDGAALQSAGPRP